MNKQIEKINIDQPRKNWDKAFALMAESGDDKLIISEELLLEDEDRHW